MNLLKTYIKKAVELVDTAVEQIKRYQSGEDTPIKTRYEHFNMNSLGGIFKGMIITIAGISGSGKTHLLQEIESDVFDKNLNKDADEYILLRCNWEMSVFKLILRKLKAKLNKSMRYLLFNKLVADELEAFVKVCDTEKSDNIFYLEEPLDPKTWYEVVQEFLRKHKDKKHVLITIDHLALVRDIIGSKKKSMDDLVEYINSLKKEFSNVSFILISQMNRDIEGRTDVRFLAPRRSDLYNTDTLFQISDLVLVVHNPSKLGHEKYMLVPKNKYKYLEDFKHKPNLDRTNFVTHKFIFFHYLKIREIEDMDDMQDLFIEPLNESAVTANQERIDSMNAIIAQVNTEEGEVSGDTEDPFLESDNNDVPF